MCCLGKFIKALKIETQVRWAPCQSRLRSHLIVPWFFVTSPQQPFWGDDFSLLSSPREQVPSNSCLNLLSFYFHLCPLISNLCWTDRRDGTQLLIVYHSWLTTSFLQDFTKAVRILFLTPPSLVCSDWSRNCSSHHSWSPALFHLFTWIWYLVYDSFSRENFGWRNNVVKRKHHWGQN